METVQQLTYRQYYGLWERLWHRKNNEIIMQARGIVRGISVLFNADTETGTNTGAPRRNDDDEGATHYDATSDMQFKGLAAQGLPALYATKETFDNMDLPDVTEILKSRGLLPTQDQTGESVE